MNRPAATAILFVLLAAILAAVIIQGRGAAPKPSDTSPSQFSAARAFDAERAILGGDVPHPVGSAAHAAVRDRLAAHFRSLGYDVRVQQSFACNAHVVCAPVENLMARAPGDARPDALALAAHYDSVPSGPGASDNGLGVATIVETARALHGVRLRNPIVLLVTDAEETGLLGAEGFAADPSIARGVAAVINIDARGTRGASFLFETSSRNEWLVRLTARALPKPATSSLFFSVYDMLPNDTDMTVFRRAGLAGVNFGNIGGVAHYHTRLDNLEHVTLSTLQHHGDHVLAMARALGDADLRQTSDGNAVWFDVLSLFIVSWPQRWSLWMAIAAIVVVLAVVVLRFADRAMPARGTTIGVAWFFLSALLAFLAGIAAAWLAELRAHGETFAAQPGPAIAAMCLIGFAVSVGLARRFHGRAGFDGLFLGQAISWCAIAIALAVKLNGASYLAVMVAVTAAVLAVARATIGADQSVVAVISGAVAAIIFFPLLLSLYDALGWPVLPAIAAVAALVTTTFAPMIAAAPLRRALVSALIITILVLIALSDFAPPYTPESPRHINVRYLDDSGATNWLADSVTPAMARAALFGSTPVRMFPWYAVPPYLFAAGAPAAALPPPVVCVIGDDRSGGMRRLTLEVRSARGATGRLALLFRTPAFRSIRVNGVTPPAPTQRHRPYLAAGWHQAIVRGAAAAQVEIVLARDESLDLIVSDTSYGLPASGAALAAARDASVAVPVHDGDSTTVLRRIRL